MSAIATVFEFESHELRTTLIDGEPWFVAVDICNVLGLANSRSSLALLDEDEKGVHTMDTPGGQQELTLVNEPGMYSLILRSRRPEAKAFKRWITHDVLPSIRKTGSYELEPRDDLEVVEGLIAAIRADRQRIAAIEEGHRELSARMDGIEGRHDWFSALGYAKLNSLSTEVGYLRRLGKSATAITRRLGFEPAKTQHDLYGEVNSYPIEALHGAVEVVGGTR